MPAETKKKPQKGKPSWVYCEKEPLEKKATKSYLKLFQVWFSLWLVREIVNLDFSNIKQRTEKEKYLL